MRQRRQHVQFAAPIWRAHLPPELPTERAIRGVAVGRNNWVFFGSDEGGKTAAALRSFVASCQRVGVDPFVWLKDILSRIAEHPINRIAELLPHNWASAQA
jgi:transposase